MTGAELLAPLPARPCIVCAQEAETGRWPAPVHLAVYEGYSPEYCSVVGVCVAHLGALDAQRHIVLLPRRWQTVYGRRVEQEEGT